MHEHGQRARSFAAFAILASMSATAVAEDSGTLSRLPPTKGWPSKVLSATVLPPSQCNRAAGPSEVIVYSLPSFGGTCATLVAGFYPRGESLGVGDDQIGSMKVGSAVRARAFFDPIYRGNVTAYVPGSNEAGLGPFNRKISSMRIEPGHRSVACSDLADNEIALFRDQSGMGDCVVLSGDYNPHDHRTGAPAAPAYPTAETMGIADDGISSARNNSAGNLVCYADQNFSGRGVTFPAHSRVTDLPAEGPWSLNDRISSCILKAP